MEGVKTETLSALRCQSCQRLNLPPTYACPYCGAAELDSVSLSGKGQIYTYTIVAMGFGHLAKKAPYVLAVVELEEGLKLTTVVEGLPGEKAAIGLPVEFSHYESGTGPMFRAIE